MPADPISYALKYHVQNAREPQWCEHCEEEWPCVTKMLADRLLLHLYFQSSLGTARLDLNVSYKELKDLESKTRKKHSPKRSRKK